MQKTIWKSSLRVVNISKNSNREHRTRTSWTSLMRGFEKLCRLKIRWPNANVTLFLKGLVGKSLKSAHFTPHCKLPKRPIFSDIGDQEAERIKIVLCLSYLNFTAFVYHHHLPSYFAVEHRLSTKFLHLYLCGARTFNQFVPAFPFVWAMAMTLRDANSTLVLGLLFCLRIRIIFYYSNSEKGSTKNGGRGSNDDD